jgi:hypothetical protein
LNVADKYVVLETPQKDPQKNLFKNSHLSSFAAKPELIKRHRFISITSNRKISQEYSQGWLSAVVYNSQTLKEV